MIKKKPYKVIIAKQVGKIGRHKVILEEFLTNKIYTADAMMGQIRVAEQGHPWKYWEVDVD